MAAGSTEFYSSHPGPLEQVLSVTDQLSGVDGRSVAPAGSFRWQNHGVPAFNKCDVYSILIHRFGRQVDIASSQHMAGRKTTHWTLEKERYEAGVVPPNKRIEPMRESAFRLVLYSVARGALPLIAHLGVRSP